MGRERNSVVNALDFVKYDLSEYFLRRQGKHITAQQLSRVYEKYRKEHPDSFFDYEDISFACAALDCRRLGRALWEPVLEIMIERGLREGKSSITGSYVRKDYV